MCYTVINAMMEFAIRQKRHSEMTALAVSGLVGTGRPFAQEQ